MSRTSTKSNTLWNLLLGLTLIGMGFSVHLTFLHYKVHTDASYQSTCNISKNFNCMTVARSAYALLLGMPVAVWGLLGYLLLLTVLLLGYRREKRTAPIYGAFLILSLVSFGMSLTYAIISHTKIHSFCTSCMATYAVNLLLPLLLWIELKQSDTRPSNALSEYIGWQTKNFPILIVLGFVTMALLLNYPQYWKTLQNTQKQTLPTGTEDGHFWIGAEKPVIRVSEFADYACGYCRFFHGRLRKLLAQYPNKIRVSHRHFPLDQKCNPTIKGKFHDNSCMFARAAHCAGQQGKFWEVNDILYGESKKLTDKQTLLNRLSNLKLDQKHFAACLDNDASKSAVKKDVDEGIRRKLKGTPYFYIDGVHINNKQMRKFEETILAAMYAAQTQKTPKQPLPQNTPANNPPAQPRPTTKPATSQPTKR